MTDLMTIVDTIADIVSAAIERGEELSAKEILDSAREHYPGVPLALLELAMQRAAARLRADAEREF